MSQSHLTIVPITLHQANAWVTNIHRHHKPVRGCRFVVGVADDEGAIRGIAISGRPVSRMTQAEGFTFEVTRVCTDGCENACSALYGACRRIGFAMGYRTGITYTLASEPGTSLRAAGWIDCGLAGGGSWDRPSRGRVDKAPTEPKRRWETRR